MRRPAARLVCHALTAALLAAALVPVAATPATATAAAIRGGDISWPNCPKGEGIPSRRSTGEPMPDRTARFVIVGLTNGPGFFPNPCFADQLSWVSRHRLLLAAYAMTTFPRPAQIQRFRSSGPYDATTRRGELRNAGYAEATYNLASMSATGMTVPMIWVDVEPYPTAPWTRNRGDNRAVITGATRAYADAGHRVGIYTYANGWRQVVGKWRLPSLPTWSTIGHGTASHARKTCNRGPSGGPDWIVQWWRDDHRDRDLVCPAAPARSLMFSEPSAA